MQKHGRRVRDLRAPYLFIICLLVSACLYAQDVNIKKGKVTDDKGQALPGVSVQIKGTSKGTSTAADGSFQIAVPDKDAVLVFSYVGYDKQELPAGSKNLQVQLGSSQSALNEVVVVGYGTQKKGDILGAVTTLDATHLIEKPLGRVEQALIGQMPGVQVRQQTGMPGQGLSILVRGSGSITAGTEPLYVIDGFPLDVATANGSGGFNNNPLNSISPNDIESVQVLKDAAAGAIYGSRAANGVVIITTKRGKAGNVKVSLNATTGISKVAKKLDILSADEWTKMATEMANTNWVNSGSGRTADQTNDQRRAILGLASGVYNTSYMADERWSLPGHPGLQYLDWQDEIFRTAPFQNYEISASGGSETVHYFFSGNYLDQTGTVLNSQYKNYGARANIEAIASKKLKFGINIAPSYTVNNAPDAEGKDNQIMKAVTMSPVVESSAGVLTGAGNYPTYTWSSARLISPVAYLNNSISRIKGTRILNSVYAEYQVIPGLFLKSTVNYDEANQTAKRYVPDYVAVGAATERITNPGKNASGSYSGFKKQNFVNENTLNYSKTIAANHNISAVAGVSYNAVHYETFTINTAGGFANNIINTLNNAIPNSAGVTVTGNTTESNNTLFSYYGRVQYDFKNKYLVSASIRRDASSKFGEDNRWGTFPSASVGWRISQEPFLKQVHFIDDLKLRLSWGKSGNNNIGDYNSIPLLSSSNYSFGGNTATVANGQVVAGLANPALRWETSNTYNAGFDASVLHNRVNVTFDVYRKKNTDLLLNLPILSASGFSTSLQNIGSVENKGLELGINTVTIRTKDFQWNTNFNIAFNSNKVLSLGESDAPIYIPSAYSGSNPPYILQKGLPMFSYYVTKTQGILTAADMADPTVAKLAKETVGDAKYYDAKKDGVINADDRVVYGQPTPKYTWGFTNNFRYKDFDLGVQVYGQHGGSILSYFGRAIDFSGSTTANVLGVWRDRWTPANQNYNAPRGKFASTYTVPYVTSDWVYSTDFWRIQNITLGYNLKGLIKTKTIGAARASISLQNWFSGDKYKGGVNPEAQNTNNSGNSSYALPGDYGAMPLSKTVALGVNFTF
ncbi:TonB-linked outer membrane protein, SusC/RagA family [Chitinophaga sp. YR573]|uniref:SusC/RagA family TonB-linked outer membrane protein n=1 Tax=Chitinophaga sp. YR573 TaxID=1881040 RepID=UPI0008C8C87D|nr:TonB-dependent receptor [Chitinophaga sp. YR573]SEW25781.1 TonB-linked outer membrane protein, SusC/RagA family [Chitinophaga sp. YR573]